MRHLLRKELRDQRAFLALALFFVVVDLLAFLVSTESVLPSFGEVFFREFEPWGNLSFLTAVLAFCTGIGLLVREQDDRTIEFLDTLPVTRLQIFAAKFLVALGIVLIYPSVVTARIFLVHAVSSDSLATSLHLDVLVVALALRVVQAVVILSVALGLSHFRRLAWLVLASLVFAFTVAVKFIPRVQVIDPTSLVTPTFTGTTWQLPWEALAVQLALASICLAVSIALFTGVGARLLQAVTSLTSSGVLGAIVTAITVVVTGAAITLLTYENKAATTDAVTLPSGGSYKFDDLGTAQAQSQHYIFTYPRAQQHLALELLAGADEVFRSVHAQLGLPEGDPIAVDLGSSGRNTHGMAYSNRVRMELLPDVPMIDQLGILRHETTHVVAGRVVGTGAQMKLASMTLFSEGLASFVQFFSHEPPEHVRFAFEFIPAAMWKRDEVKAEELFDSDAFHKHRSEVSAYALGKLFVDVLVAKHGKEAPLNVLKALARPDAPENLSEPVLWQDTFQAAGYDLPLLVDEMYASLEMLADKHAAAVAETPRLRAAIEKGEDGRAIVRPISDSPLPQGWVAACRFKSTGEAHRFDVDGTYYARPHCERLRRDISGGELHYQLGVFRPEGTLLLQPWASARFE